jgi:lathosterol oxidase
MQPAADRRHSARQHHTWLVPTPFASHAFHPVDGFMQGLPYSLFIFIMPLNKYVHLGMFILV